MVPENVTVVPRTTSLQQPTEMEERLIIVRHGQTLEEALHGAGIDDSTAAQVANAFAPKPGEPAVAEGRRLKLLMADLNGSGNGQTLARLSVYNDETLETTIAITEVAIMSTISFLPLALATLISTMPSSRFAMQSGCALMQGAS